MRRWTQHIDISTWWNDESLSFEAKRDSITDHIQGTRWYRDSEMVRDIVENLSHAIDADEWDNYWASLYDEADCDRVWIETIGRAS